MQAVGEGEYMNTIKFHFEGRREKGNMRRRTMDTAEQHLHRRRQPQKVWILVDTLKLTETKWLALVYMLAEVVHLCKKGREEVRSDKEKWWNVEMALLEEKLRYNREGDLRRD